MVILIFLPIDKEKPAFYGWFFLPHRFDL